MLDAVRRTLDTLQYAHPGFAKPYFESAQTLAVNANTWNLSPSIVPITPFDPRSLNPFPFNLLRPDQPISLASNLY